MPSNGSEQMGTDGMKTRLQRAMADAGVAARRVCEQMIEEGRVEVNGEVVKRLPVFVDPERDSIRVDGRALKRPERKLYIMLHKPPRTLVSNTDEPGMDRPTAISFVEHPSKPRLFPVGRLDYDTSGLLLLTNDGDLAHRLTHPRFGISKTYLATIRGTVTPEFLADVVKKMAAMERREARELPHGRRGARPKVAERAALLAEGVNPASHPPRMRLVKTDGERTVIEIVMIEAKNRQLQESLKLLGAPVKKLVRVELGPLTLRGLAPGHWRELTREELQSIRRASEGKWKPGDRRADKARKLASDARHMKNSRRESPVANRQGPPRHEAAQPDATDSGIATNKRVSNQEKRIAPRPIRPEQKPIRKAEPTDDGPRPRVLLPEKRRGSRDARSSA